MKRRGHKAKLPFLLAILTVGGTAVVCLNGCGDSARHAVAYHPRSIVAPAPVLLGPLPVSASIVAIPSIVPQRPDGTSLLEKQVAAVFNEGEQEYKAGHLSSARQKFDLALDLLLESGFDFKNEPRLGALFDHIVETTHSDEVIAFREGDGFSEQKTTPAPMDEISTLTAPLNLDEAPPAVPADPRLRSSAEGELKDVPHDLPLTVNDAVLSFVNFFQTQHGRAIVETGLGRAGRYRPMIERVLREEGLPSDLMYMAQAESAFQPQALSRAGARGLWQFMSYRGKEYGLEHSWWVDERQDPEKATRAAAEHLRDLYQMFGDWYLVMAAYNSGPGTVQRAVERTGYADFWELYKRNALPQETRNYVPIILALTLIAKDPARYGITIEPEQPLQADSVQPGHPIDLRLVAETIDVDLETLRSLNPELLRLVTPAQSTFVLHLPQGTAERFNAEIAAIPPDKWVSWRRHRVETGETLSAIARQYKVATAAIADANGLDSQVSLEVGEKLIIPIDVQSQPTLGKLVRYRTRRGDTVESIADEFDVGVAELKKWNRLRSNQVARGIRLKIYPGGMTPPPATNSGAVVAPVAHKVNTQPVPTMRASADIAHRVQPGETLYSIARAYQTTVEALRAGNRFLLSRPLEAGDMLSIFPPQ